MVVWGRWFHAELCKMSVVNKKKKKGKPLSLRFLYTPGTSTANPRDPEEELVSGMERPLANLCSFRRLGAGLGFCCASQASRSWNSSCLLHRPRVPLLSPFGLQAPFSPTPPKTHAWNRSRLALWDLCSNARRGISLCDLKCQYCGSLHNEHVEQAQRWILDVCQL